MDGMPIDVQLPVQATVAGVNIDRLENALSKHLTGRPVEHEGLDPLPDISDLIAGDRPAYRFQSVSVNTGLPPTYTPYSPILVSPTLLPGNLVNIPFLRRKVNFLNNKRPDRYILDLLQRRSSTQHPISYSYVGTGHSKAKSIGDVEGVNVTEDWIGGMQGALPSYLAEGIYSCRQCATSHHSCVYDNTGPPISVTEELVPNSWSTNNPVTVQSVGCVACNDSGKPCQFTIHLGHVKVINATIALRLHDPSTLQSVSLSNFKADPLKYIAIIGGEVKEEVVEHTRLAGRHRASSPSNGLGDHGIHFPTAGSSLAGKRKGHESDGTKSIDMPLKRARPDRPMFIDAGGDAPFTYEYTGVDYATSRTIGMGASRVRLERRLHSELYNNNSSNVGKLVSALLEAVRQPAEDDLVAQMHPQLVDIEREIRYLRAQNDRLRYELADATRMSSLRATSTSSSGFMQLPSPTSSSAGFDLMIAIDKNNPGPSRLHDLPNHTDAIHISQAVLFHDVSAETSGQEDNITRVRICGLGEHVSINSFLQTSATHALTETAVSSRQFDLSTGRRRRHSDSGRRPGLPHHTPLQALQAQAGPPDDFASSSESTLRGWNDLPHHQRGLELLGRGSSSNPSDPAFWRGWSDFAALAYSWGHDIGLLAPAPPTKQYIDRLNNLDWSSLSRRNALAGGSHNPYINKDDEIQVIKLSTVASGQLMRPDLLQYTESQIQSRCRDLQTSLEDATATTIGIIPGMVLSVQSARPNADEIAALHLRSDAMSNVWLHDLQAKLSEKDQDIGDSPASKMVLGYMSIGRYFFPIEFERNKEGTRQICVYSNTDQAMGRSYVRQVFKAYLGEHAVEVGQSKATWVYEARPSRFEVDNSHLSGPLLIHLFMLCLSAGRVDGISPGVTEITRSAWIEDENDVDQIAKLVYAQMEWVVQLAEWSVDIVKKVRDVAAVRVGEL